MTQQLTNLDNSTNTLQNYENECDYDISFYNYKNVEFKVGPSLFTEINIYESLFEDNVVNGDITFSDSAGWEERLPIIGQEKIKISFFNKRIPANKFEGTYIVYKMSEKMIRDRIQMYTLFFISEEYIINLKNKVSKSYKAKTASEIVSSIYDTYIAKNVTKNRKPLYFDKVGDSDSSFYLNHIVFPRIRPFQAINMLARKATPINVKNIDTNLESRNFSSFVFYENSMGFWFKSIGDLLNPLRSNSAAEFVENSLDEIYEEKGLDSQNVSSSLRENKNKLRVNVSSVASSVRVPMATYVIVPQIILDIVFPQAIFQFNHINFYLHLM